MSNKREALEAGLGLAKNHLDDGEHHPESYKYILDVIATIEAALAEPEQEPVAKQYKHSKTGEWCNFIDEKHYKDTLESGLFEIRSLYTSPREWRELSEIDITNLLKRQDDWYWQQSPRELISSASAALRAKNGG